MLMPLYSLDIITSVYLPSMGVRSLPVPLEIVCTRLCDSMERPLSAREDERVYTFQYMRLLSVLKFQLAIMV